MVGCSTLDGVFDYDLPQILKERVVGTPGHMEVQQVSGGVGWGVCPWVCVGVCGWVLVFVGGCWCLWVGGGGMGVCGWGWMFL